MGIGLRLTGKRYIEVGHSNRKFSGFATMQKYDENGVRKRCVPRIRPRVLLFPVCEMDVAL